MPVNRLTQTPMAERIHIGIFGSTNSGKSSLINAISDQEIALVSSVAGTTTDPVYKAMELHPIGPCVFIDTAGFDDVGELGKMRIEKTKALLDKIDVAMMIFSPDKTNFDYEFEWLKILEKSETPVLCVYNKSDVNANIPEEILQKNPVVVSAKNKKGINELKKQLVELVGKDFELPSITGHLVGEGDSVLLVAPQDIQAPKGRLILPQVQILRDLLDLKAIVTVITTDKLEQTLAAYKEPPKLIITDSQVFSYVYERTPKESQLTSFSVLMARYKGDIDEYIDGSDAIQKLSPTDKVLVLEACTHNPLDGDIGRIQIPNMLRKKISKDLQVDVVSGAQIPENLGDYSLVIHCGGCMFNRRYVLSRIAKCKELGVPITNYGIFIAKMGGILENIKS
ncbi:MAG: small GTP-binding protein [Oscillospiraceae bacterium]|jgi:[FeFe] hydrogenase H-cluster maturation GTPase HydF|nr:small GTP-binding protein [Oscillospiraceae bacterium]